MSKQTKLEVWIPHTTTDGWLDGRLRNPVRGLLRQHGGQKISRYHKEPLSSFIRAVFPDRNMALNAVMAIRKLSLKHVSELAHQFSFTIDNVELLLFNDEADEYSFESKNYHDALQEWYEEGRVESPVLP